MSPSTGHPGDLLSAWLDGELTPGEARDVAAHVDGCSACGAERDQVEASRAAVRGLPSLAAPAGVLRATPAVHVGDLISACLDGEIASDLRPGIEAHLAACPACAAEHDEVAWARMSLRALPLIDPPTDVLRPAWAWPAPVATGRPAHARMRPRSRQLLAATAAVAAAGIGVLGLVGREGPADPSRPAVASFVSQHSTSSPGPDAVSGLAPAAMPISFTR